MAFAAVFAYQVDPSATAAFEAAYGQDGDWAQFFRRGHGFLGTELLRDPPRYLVIDRWRSAAAYYAFLAIHADEYRRRNEAAASLYRAEEVLGRFESG
jgi:heme-degrading monooxygenase HmoA